MTAELLRLEDITCRDQRGIAVVDHVSFVLRQGKVLWVTGAGGSGKTTLLNSIIKGIRPDSGEIYFQGAPLWGRGSIARSVLRRQIGVIFQDDCLLTDRNAIQNVATALTISGCSRAHARERSYQALHDVGLTPRAEHLVELLSSSERRLLSLARVLAKMPPLAVADLNSCDVDQKTIAPRLETLANYGSGVLILSKQHSPVTETAHQTAELALE